MSSSGGEGEDEGGKEGSEAAVVYNLTSTERMISACSGTLLTSFFVTPFDVVKTRLQTFSGPTKCLLYCNNAVEHLCFSIYGDHNHGKHCLVRPKFQATSTVKVMWKLVKCEGPKSLWSGLTPTLLMSAPGTMIYYPTYEYMRDRLRERSDSPAVPALAGAIGRSAAVTVVTPMDLIRTKMQSKLHSSQELANTVRASIKHDGIKSMYIGWVPTMLRDVPFSMMYWFLYEEIKSRLEISSLFVKSFVCGLTSGAVSAIMTQPFDVLKTKRQVMLGETKLFGANARTVRLRNIAREIYIMRGPSGFFVGLAPRLLKVAPACAIMITSYELSKRVFGDYHENHKNK